MGQSREDAAFNTGQSFSRTKIAEHYGSFFAVNKESIEKEKFEGA